MSIIEFVVVGDRTSHGGVALTGESKFLVHGQPTAYVGSDVYCPRCKRTTKIVSSKFPTMTAHGKTLTLDGDTTDCGAVLDAQEPTPGNTGAC